MYIDVGKSEYEGEWKNNMKNGHGKEVFDNGDEYVGQYKDDLKHGDGQFASNNTFNSGQFVEDMMEGYGKFKH